MNKEYLKYLFKALAQCEHSLEEEKNRVIQESELAVQKAQIEWIKGKVIEYNEAIDKYLETH